MSVVALSARTRPCSSAIRSSVLVAFLVLSLGGPPAVLAQHDPHENHGPGGHDDHAGPAHDDHDATARHRFDDVERWVERFDDPERDGWQKPESVIAFLAPPEDAVVADIGAGTGYFTVRLARALGGGGRVLAVDVEQALVEHIRARAERDGLSGVETILGEFDDPGLPEAGVDRILIVDTWHHIDDRLSYLDRLERALRPGGTVVVVDFREGDLPVGPPPGHKLSERHVRGEFDKAGWTLVETSDTLAYQYMLKFRP
jgi:ubiquinone/menaquinone biosynthesis C-methylase UbiE